MMIDELEKLWIESNFEINLILIIQTKTLFQEDAKECDEKLDSNSDHGGGLPSE